MYLDETWANARDSVEKMWVEDDPVVSGGTIGGVCKPSGKGNRLIILHAAYFEEWFHDSFCLIYKATP